MRIRANAHFLNRAILPKPPLFENEVFRSRTQRARDFGQING